MFFHFTVGVEKILIFQLPSHCMRGIAIPFKFVYMMDLDFLDLNSKGILLESSTEEVIVIEPSQKLIESLERLKAQKGIGYRWLSADEVERFTKTLLIGD